MPLTLAPSYDPRMTRTTDHEHARALRDHIEPLVGQVYFSPECHAAYAGLGFGGSPVTIGDVAMPDGAAYFTSRGSLMGQVPGEVVAAAFAVFNPAVVVPAVSYGWSLTDAETHLRGAPRRRLPRSSRGSSAPDPDGHSPTALALLRRACEPLEPAGKPLFAGTLSQEWPGDPIGDLFHAGDLLREYRGDAHTAAWTARGSTRSRSASSPSSTGVCPPAPTSARARGATSSSMPPRPGSSSGAGWPTARSPMPAAPVREEIERTTDAQLAPAVRALGDEIDALLGMLGPWGAAVIAAGGYPGVGGLLGSGRDATG